ncbi:FAS1-like dehydratase domain-containing protein [Roseococcus sp. YIM B11640]|uniref:FAS1-like dehydratase domain-containing protein n=1 Tax=Roseococcus sp. YIM B11640 TaxID=3133973 RepID=UPI003C79AF27
MSYEDYVGRTETRQDRLDARLVEGLAATLGRPAPERDVPPLWHWMLFQDWRMPSGIGVDGHPKRGGFLPPVDDLPRRMWAGGRLGFAANPLRVGDTVSRISTITAVSEKSGGSGRLVFVTVRHEVAGPAGLAVTEEQDIVYRGAEGAAVRAGEAAPAFGETQRLDLTPDPVMLFRYSALTGNGHRIHYDQPYATGEEGYPGLVVHGPLQATLLAQTILDAAPGMRLESFAFRGRRPCFAGNALSVLARVEGRKASAETRDHTGATCMSVDAVLA